MMARHERISLRLVLTTGATLALLMGAAVAAGRLAHPVGPWLLGAAVVALGFWLDRIYVVAHEAAHSKLFPGHRRLNDLVGSVLLWPLVVPLVIFRKIHFFHHGMNRRDEKTSALDVFVTASEPTPLRRAWYGVAWFLCVFAGGFFVHSLVTILIFLFVPTSLATRISPAFKGWPPRQRALAWLELGFGIGFHAVIWNAFGRDAWAFALGLPLLAFAWLWSVLLYIYHYDTTIGPSVGLNVRSLQRNAFFSWLLLNFNEHVTHHANPKVPWYELPDQPVSLPPAFASNANVTTIWQAVLHQLKGPRIVLAGERTRRAPRHDPPSLAG